MSAVSLSSWIPVTFDTDVEGTEVQASTVSAVGRMRAMTSNAHEVPMLLGADVSGGVTLTDDTFNGKKATMYSYLFNGKQTLVNFAALNRNGTRFEVLMYTSANSHICQLDASGRSLFGYQLAVGDVMTARGG